MTDEPGAGEPDFGSPRRLLEAELAQQRMRWRSGGRVLVEEFLERRPGLTDDRDAVLDLLYNEVLLRREGGEAPLADEYLQRFPDLAESLRLLFEVDAGLEFDGGVSTAARRSSQVPAGKPRESLPEPVRQPSDAVAPLRLVAADSVRGAVELHAMLQRRLRFVSVLVALLYLQAGWQLRTIWHIDRWPHYRTQMTVVWSVLSIAASCAVFFLLRRRPVSVAWLRIFECALFAAPLVQLTCVLVDLTWLQADLLRVLQSSGHESGYLFNSIVLFYFPSVTSYGVLIPNTWRRCLAVTLCMGLAPLAVLLAGLPSTPEIWAAHRAAFLEGFCWVAMWMGVAVSCSVYGSHRIHVLQREASAARRLGQYRLRRRIGSGGMGEVYLAEHELLKQPCAVKIIRPERAGDPAALRRFQREVQATARLKHWNTVAIFDYGVAADGTFYYVMEHLPGMDLEVMVRRQGPLLAPRVCHFLRQACAALREAHAIGLIHRDIKPANLIVCERGGVHDVVKVLDFGLVRDVAAAGDDGTLTLDGTIAGTPAYMSPEQAAGSRELDERSDVYSLGAVAYFLLAGKPPFADRSPMQVLAAHIYEAPRPLVELRPDVPADLAAVVMRCLAKDPADRHPGAASLDAAVAASTPAGRWSEAEAAQWWVRHGDRPEAVPLPNASK